MPIGHQYLNRDVGYRRRNPSTNGTSRTSDRLGGAASRSVPLTSTCRFLSAAWGAVQRVDDLFTVKTVFAAAVGRTDGPGGSFKQSHAELALKRADFATEGGDRSAGTTRRFREAAVLKHACEQHHRIEVGSPIHISILATVILNVVYCLDIGMTRNWRQSS